MENLQGKAVTKKQQSKIDVLMVDVETLVSISAVIFESDLMYFFFPLQYT